MVFHDNKMTDENYGRMQEGNMSACSQLAEQLSACIFNEVKDEVKIGRGSVIGIRDDMIFRVMGEVTAQIMDLFFFLLALCIVGYIPVVVIVHYQNEVMVGNVFMAFEMAGFMHQAEAAFCSTRTHSFVWQLALMPVSDTC